MAPVAVVIERRPVDSEEVEFVPDLDALVESTKCSCNAGDDNPY